MNKASLALGALIIILGGFFAFNSYIYNEKQGDQNAFKPVRVTLAGEYVCLPHKEPGDFHTMECTFGLKTDSGEFYGIDFMLMSQMGEEPGVGDRIQANGVVVPVERLDNDFWKTYPIVGIFSVTDSLEVFSPHSSKYDEGELSIYLSCLSKATEERTAWVLERCPDPVFAPEAYSDCALREFLSEDIPQIDCTPPSVRE